MAAAGGIVDNLDIGKCYQTADGRFLGKLIGKAHYDLHWYEGKPKDLLFKRGRYERVYRPDEVLPLVLVQCEEEAAAAAAAAAAAEAAAEVAAAAEAAAAEARARAGVSRGMAKYLRYIGAPEKNANVAAYLMTKGMLRKKSRSASKKRSSSNRRRRTQRRS
jgi:hypothetical protein